MLNTTSFVVNVDILLLKQNLKVEKAWKETGMSSRGSSPAHIFRHAHTSPPLADIRRPCVQKMCTFHRSPAPQSTPAGHQARQSVFIAIYLQCSLHFLYPSSSNSLFLLSLVFFFQVSAQPSPYPLTDTSMSRKPPSATWKVKLSFVPACTVSKKQSSACASIRIAKPCVVGKRRAKEMTERTTRATAIFESNLPWLSSGLIGLDF